LQRKLAEERERIKSEAAKEVRNSVSIEIADLRQQAAERDRKLEAMSAAELALRKEKRELEEKAKTLELVRRQTD
jgi:hypothetical protein